MVSGLRCTVLPAIEFESLVCQDAFCRTGKRFAMSYFGCARSVGLNVASCGAKSAFAATSLTRGRAES
jgi:hypothetical protein